MAAKSNTNIFLIVLGVVSVGVLGYLIFIFLAPSASIAPVSGTVSTDVQSGVVSSPSFQQLQPFANLPIVASSVGRVNPFAPFIIANPDVNGNENTNAVGNINAQ
jgi:hypothetical protein